MGRARGRAVGPCRAGLWTVRRGWSSARGWVTVHPAYNIHRGGARPGAHGCTGTISTHQRSDRGGGKVVERREVAIPRAVSCSHVQPRASFCRAFYLFFACPVILTSGAARCIGTAEKKCADNLNKQAGGAWRTRESRVKSRGRRQRVATLRKGKRGGKSLGRSVRGV